MKKYYMMLIEDENDDEKIRVFSGNTLDECARKRDRYVKYKLGTHTIAGVEIENDLSPTNRAALKYLMNTPCWILDFEKKYIV